MKVRQTASGLVAGMARLALTATKRWQMHPGLRSWLVSVGYQGAFQSTDPLNFDLRGWTPRNATADQTLVWNLTNLIAQCRQLERENPTARGAIEDWKAGIVGTGIGIEPDTGNPEWDAMIRDDWLRWCEDCTPEGNSLWELQSQAMGEWCTAGSHLWQVKIDESRIDRGLPPIVLAPIEAEWLTLYPIKPIGKGNVYIRGVEMTQDGVPVAYHVMDYNLLNTLGIGTAYGGPGSVINAADIIHGFEKRRPRQTHGEPILAIGITRLKQEEQLVSIELKAARNTALIANAITSEMHPDMTDQYGNPVDQIVAGATIRLAPGEDIKTIENKRPSEKIGPFRSVLRGDLASALRVSRQALDRDYSTANYSSMRTCRIDLEKIRKPVQQTFARTAASAPYLRVLPWILMARGIAIPSDKDQRARLFNHRVMPDREKYLDPVKDANAAIYAVQNGLSTLQKECASIGEDYEQVRARRLQELKEQDQANVERIASIQAAIQTLKNANPGLQLEWYQVMAAGGADSNPATFVQGVARGHAATSAAGKSQDEQEDSDAA